MLHSSDKYALKRGLKNQRTKQNRTDKHSLEPKQIKKKNRPNHTMNGLQYKQNRYKWPSGETTSSVTTNRLSGMQHANSVNSCSCAIRLHAILSCRSCCRMSTATMGNLLLTDTQAGLPRNVRLIPTRGSNSTRPHPEPRLNRANHSAEAKRPGHKTKPLTHFHSLSQR
jgi:hypothetical protein